MGSSVVAWQGQAHASSPDELRSAAAGGAAGEDAAAEERAFERAIAVDAAPAEARNLARGEDVAERLPVRLEHAPGQICLEPAQRLARQRPQPYGDERSARGIEQLVRLGHADELVAEVVARAVDRRDLRILGEAIVHFAIARRHLALHIRERKQSVSRQRVHARHEPGEILLDHEIRALLHEGTHGLRHPAAAPRAQHGEPASARQVRVLFRARQREFPGDDLLRQDEPGMVMALSLIHI